MVHQFQKANLLQKYCAAVTSLLQLIYTSVSVPSNDKYSDYYVATVEK